jgi:hypothetical protein
MKAFPLSGGSLRILLGLYLPAASLFAQAGSVTGLVTDESAKPIAGALITAHRATLPAASGSATAAVQGTFQIGGLAPGSYTVCVQVPGTDFLDTCEWAILPPRVDVKAGQAVTGLRFKLKKGAILHVRLNDPRKLLEPAASGKTVPYVLMGVQTAKGLLHPAALVSKDATGRTHAVMVPFDTPLKFTLYSPHVALADEKGAPAGHGPIVPITLPSGASPKPLTFNVTGPK